MIAVLGWFVGIIDVAQFLPQARRVLAHRHDTDALGSLSISTWAIATIQGIAWIVYGSAEHLTAIAAPNLLITPTCAAILTVRLRLHLRSRWPRQRPVGPSRYGPIADRPEETRVAQDGGFGSGTMAASGS